MALEIQIDVSGALAKLASLGEPSRTVRLYAQTRLAALCAPYVPMDTGMLYQTTAIDEDGVTYLQPYAHYQWEGVSRFSGRPLRYSKEQHPQASAHWLEPAMAAHKDQLCGEIAALIAKEAGK